MRLLIKYLLFYILVSINKKTISREVHLHDIFRKKVQEDLEDRIKEWHYLLLWTNYLRWRAIPFFRWKQLFNNLFSTPLKYKGIEDPKVIIACKKLNRNEITDDFIKKSKWLPNFGYRYMYWIWSRNHSGKKIFETLSTANIRKNEYSEQVLASDMFKKIVSKSKSHIICRSGARKRFCCLPVFNLRLK